MLLQNKLHKQVRLGCLVCCLQLPAWWPNLLGNQRELDFGVVELFGALPLAELGRNGGSLYDLNAVVTNSVTRTHFSVHLLNSTIQSGVTVLFVHVMISSPTLVPQPNAIVLNGRRIFLKDLQHKYMKKWCLSIKCNCKQGDQLPNCTCICKKNMKFFTRKHRTFA